MANINENLVRSLYKKYSPNEDVDSKLKYIQDKYGEDQDLFVKSFYKKYAPEENVDSKLEYINSSYPTSAIKKPKKEEVDYDLSAGVDEETKEGVGKYTEALMEIDKYTIPEKGIPKLQEMFSTDLKREGSDSAKYMEQALKSLKAQNKALSDAKQPVIPITDESQQAEAFKLFKQETESGLKNRKTQKLMEDFETEFGIDRTSSWGKFTENMFKFSPATQKQTVKYLQEVAKEKGLTKDQWELFYKQQVTNTPFIGGDALNYIEARQELNKQLKIKGEELQKPYVDAVSNITADRKDIDHRAKEIDEIEANLKEIYKNVTKALMKRLKP